MYKITANAALWAVINSFAVVNAPGTAINPAGNPSHFGAIKFLKFPHNGKFI
jgi:hypothetical protein